MCCHESSCDKLKEVLQFQKYFKALHCSTRWNIINIIGEEEKGTGEIIEELAKLGETLSKSSIYYHLAELEKTGIIKQSRYREEGGGAPEKLWKLVMREIKIDLLGSKQIGNDIKSEKKEKIEEFP